MFKLQGKRSLRIFTCSNWFKKQNTKPRKRPAKFRRLILQCNIQRGEKKFLFFRLTRQPAEVRFCAFAGYLEQNASGFRCRRRTDGIPRAGASGERRSSPSLCCYPDGL